MLTLHQIYKIMAEDADGGLWLPDFSDSEVPKWKNGEYVPDTEEVINFICNGLLNIW